MPILGEAMPLITSGIKVAFALLFVGIFLFVLYRGTLHRIPNWKFTLKYKIFKKKVSDNIKDICIGAKDSGISAEDLAKGMMINEKYTLSQSRELIYLYKKINNGL